MKTMSLNVVDMLLNEVRNDKYMNNEMKNKFMCICAFNIFE